jgi:hypothetical protein
MFITTTGNNSADAGILFFEFLGGGGGEDPHLNIYKMLGKKSPVDFLQRLIKKPQREKGGRFLQEA